jgi:hypothetical protein
MSSESVRESRRKWIRNNPLRHAFCHQSWEARNRGIRWELSFDQWLSVWEGSGNLENRGRGKDKYCMARHGDEGPYSVENVYITTNSQNLSDAWVNKRCKPPACKLKREQYDEIRRRASLGEKVIDLAKEYGLSPPHVSRIKNGWLPVGGEL